MTQNSQATLCELFDQSLSLHTQLKALDSSDIKNSSKFQHMLLRAIKDLEDATRLVSILDIFSRNEDVAEIETKHLKYFLLPVLLADLTNLLSVQATSSSPRMEVLNTCDVYHRDFLQRCYDYGIISDIPNLIEESVNLLPVQADRQTKLQRYLEKTQISKDLTRLKEIMNHPAGYDDEIERQYYIKLIKQFVVNSCDELEGNALEKSMLKYRSKIDAGDAELPKLPTRPSVQPVVITKQKIQNQVFGVGYSSLPVMSVEEFYEQRVREGSFCSRGSNKLVKPAEDKDSADEDELARMRAFDDYKDEHRRGDGNRHNMG